MDRRWLLAAGVALTAVLAGIWWGRGVALPPAAPTSPIPSLPPSSPPTTGTDVVVHVSGWVVDPGLVSLQAGARVGDAVAAAGGVRPGARLERLNLARVVGDGHQVVVPGPGEVGSDESAVPAETGDGLIHVNTATAADLEALPGVGPVLAERIVSHRETNGDFEQVEDLLQIPGIGEAKLGSIRDLVAVP